MIIGVHEFILKDRAAERQKRETTRELMKESWPLHTEVLENMRHFNTLLRNERPGSLSLENIKKQQSDILDFYLKLESCIEAGLCDEKTAKKLFCGIAVEEASRYYELLFRYDEVLGYLGKTDGVSAGSIDLSMYRFICRCPKENMADNDEPPELIGFRERLSPQKTGTSVEMEESCKQKK
jgi:hypothetical protein